MSLKQKTVNGIFWSFVDTIAGQGVTFIVGLILARLLSPYDFGLIGMLGIFMAISETFVYSGLGNALIRKKECTQNDYSTVFIFNLIVGILFYLILFFTAHPISIFFNEPELKPILQILGLVLIIDATSLIHKTILTKRIDFKLQAKVSIIASSVSGVIAIAMAYYGFGVWALVAQRLIRQTLYSLLFWILNKWRPLMLFCKQSFNELFGFGSKLLISALINNIYLNIYQVIIGKYFSTHQLGYYTRANEFNNLPSQNICTVISRVTYPVLAAQQDDIPRLRENYKKLIRMTTFVSFILMLGMAAIAEPLILTLIGSKWQQSIIYLQILCFSGMLYPLQALNLNMLQVQGRSDLFLKIEILKKIVVIPVILAGIIWGIKTLLVGMVISSFISYYLNSMWSGKGIGYPFIQQIKDLLPALVVALTMSTAVFSIGLFLPFTNPINLILLIAIGAIITIAYCEISKFRDYILIKNLVIEQLQNFRKAKKQ